MKGRYAVQTLAEILNKRRDHFEQEVSELEKKLKNATRKLDNTNAALESLASHPEINRILDDVILFIAAGGDPK